MERLVDYDKFIKDYGVLSNHEDDYRLLCAANITAYTKDEVIAMLTELEKKIEGQCKIPNNCASAYDWNNGVYACYNVIQQKINELKTESEDKE